MDKKKVFLTEEAKSFFDLTINGEQVRVSAGDFVLTDAQGNVEVVDSDTYYSEYSVANPEGEVVKTSDKKKSKAKSAPKDETPIEAEPEAVAETVNDEPVPNEVEQSPVTEGYTEGETDGRH